MTKITLAVAAALVLGSIAAPAQANYLGECKAYLQYMLKTPDGEPFQPVIDKKFGGDIVEFCGCTEDTIKASPQGDLPNTTADLKTFNDAVEDGAPKAKLMSMINNLPKLADFGGAALMCSTPAK